MIQFLMFIGIKPCALSGGGPFDHLDQVTRYEISFLCSSESKPCALSGGGSFMFLVFAINPAIHNIFLCCLILVK